jgi:hypothetical protein
VRRFLARLRAFLGRGALTLGFGGARALPRGELCIHAEDIEAARIDATDVELIHVCCEDVELARIDVNDTC